MRCAIVVSDLGAGGTQRLALGLAGHLLGRGLGVDLLSLDGPGTDIFFPVPEGIRVNRLGVNGDSTNPLAALSANLGRVRTLRRALSRIRAELVVSFLTTTNILALLAARALRIPVIVAEESDPGHEPIARPWALLRRLTYGQAHHIVVHSCGAAAFFRGKTASRVQVIPNPVEPCPWVAIPETTNAPRHPLVVAMGRLSPEKGFDVLISAFAQIALLHPDWSLVILGDGPLRADLERRVATLGMAGRIALPGYSRTPAETLHRAAIFCSSARVEGFGLALCEAMACGLPVVSTDAPSGPREIIRPGIDGDLVAVDDAKALGKALSALIADPHRRRAYAARAPEVMERFSPSRVWAVWDALIDSGEGDGP